MVCVRSFFFCFFLSQYVNFRFLRPFGKRSHRQANFELGIYISVNPAQLLITPLVWTVSSGLNLRLAALILPFDLVAVEIRTNVVRFNLRLVIY